MDAVVQATAALVAAYLITPLLEVAWQSFRAPSIELQRHNADLEDRIAALEARLVKQEFDIDVQLGRRYAVWPSGATGNFSDGNEVWIVLTDLLLTNRASHRLPLELRIYVSTLDDGSRFGERVGDPPLPGWVQEQLGAVISGQVLLQTPLNLDPRSSHFRSYCGIRVSGTFAELVGVTTSQQLMDERPLWLHVQNLITNAHREYPLNRPAAARARSARSA